MAIANLGGILSPVKVSQYFVTPTSMYPFSMARDDSPPKVQPIPVDSLHSKSWVPLARQHCCLYLPPSRGLYILSLEHVPKLQLISLGRFAISGSTFSVTSKQVLFLPESRETIYLTLFYSFINLSVNNKTYVLLCLKIENYIPTQFPKWQYSKDEHSSS